MDDMSHFLIPILVAAGMWPAVLLRLERRRRALVSMPFALAACVLLFWRIPMKQELEVLLEVLSILAAASLIALPFVWQRRKRREQRLTD